LRLARSEGVTALGVHRIVERQTAARGEQIAVANNGSSLTYRELNTRANVAARQLIARGLRRGSRVNVAMEPSADLAVLLLAVLKAGGAYMWSATGPGCTEPDSISIVSNGIPSQATHIVIDPTTLIGEPVRPAPNLPIVTRPDDIACVLPQRNGLPGVFVPHATIAAMQAHPVPNQAVWSGEAAALDLWLPLMAGRTVLVGESAEHIAAA
jgi:non-ribosomal peptide synthetase component F